MKIRHTKSGMTNRCAVCEKFTNFSKIYEEGNISIRVPVCDREDSDCHTKVTMKETVREMLRQLKLEVTQ